MQFVLLDIFSQDTSIVISASKTKISSCINESTSISASVTLEDYGTANDGDLIISNTYYSDNIRTHVSSSNIAGDYSINVANSNGFNIGDEILIITMQDPNFTNNSVGKYEFNRINSVGANNLGLYNPLTHTYVSTSTIKHQVVKVLNFNNLTINSGGILTAHPWDGFSGGIICFRVSGQLLNNGIITANEIGYRGVGRINILTGNNHYRNHNGAQGEGIYGEGYPGGSSNGSNGFWNQSNGNGGGGGTGTQDGGGGGIIYISAGSINNNGLITSNGENGGNGTNSNPNGSNGSGCGMAGGGGGAGGSIFISSPFHSSYGLITANKGFKGNCTCGVGFGADGSDGRIAFISSNGNNPISFPIANQGISNPISGVTYNWSNGMSGSDIIVTPSITTKYFVNATIGNKILTDSIEIKVLQPPLVPDIANVSHCPGTFTFSASSDSLISNGIEGSLLKWYSSATDSLAIYYGNSFTTPTLNTNTTYYYNSVAENEVSPFDRTNSSVSLAVGLRKLVPNYNGNLIRLRRSTDNSLMDFGFNSEGELDISAIQSWLGSGTGYVTILYDQSGN